MVKITLYKKNGFGEPEHIDREEGYLAYVDVINEDIGQTAQVGSISTINYLPHGWVIIEGDHITIQEHDGKGNRIYNSTQCITIGRGE